MTKNLEFTYLQTLYRVCYKNKFYDLKIGVRNNEFDLLCNQLEINSWMIVTAYNPYSKKYSDQKNEFNNQQLKNTLLQEELIVF
ncbi:hypothetical protein [Aquimarina sp. 2201CG5-10]|uniref:hypothetical protein n=1 Tax=Aquimarina callyspongiae TaxID=3098150 RepID=UPI002AB3F089|nr:hypothetical protein [Aquimarina sp. 2201CG5-10]MDY8134323.1 hypothetical protein [Aquimarina sp. 2201CG5-10]